MLTYSGGNAIIRITLNNYENYGPFGKRYQNDIFTCPHAQSNSRLHSSGSKPLLSRKCSWKDRVSVWVITIAPTKSPVGFLFRVWLGLPLGPPSRAPGPANERFVTPSMLGGPPPWSPRGGGPGAHPPWWFVPLGFGGRMFFSPPPLSSFPPPLVNS